jgi:hypothetical protein
MRMLVASLLLVPAAALASSAFDGTWKTKVGSVNVTGKPDVMTLADGMYSCPSCAPEFKIKADGTDQKVSGHDYFDTLAVKVVDAKTVERTFKLGGKLLTKDTITVSADGKTLTFKFIDHSGAKEATGEFTESRVAAGPAGAHAMSGSWQPGNLDAGNEALRTWNYEMGADHFSMHWNGQSYNAKFDGKEYAVENDPGHTVVTLKRIDANTVEETDHRAGKVTDEIRLSASKDGKTLNVTDKDPIHGQTTTFTLEKQ